VSVCVKRLAECGHRAFGGGGCRHHHAGVGRKIRHNIHCEVGRFPARFKPRTFSLDSLCAHSLWWMRESSLQWGPTQGCILSSTMTVVPARAAPSMYAFIC
jgi:hypothetical protein